MHGSFREVIELILHHIFHPNPCSCNPLIPFHDVELMNTPKSKGKGTYGLTLGFKHLPKAWTKFFQNNIFRHEIGYKSENNKSSSVTTMKVVKLEANK